MFSLRTLLIAVAIAALGAAALATRTLWWASAVMMVTLAILATATLLSIAQPRSRPTALGFVIFAGFYALVTWSNVFEPVKFSLPTSRAIFAAWKSLDIAKPIPVTEIEQDGSTGFSQMVYEMTDAEQYASHPLLNHTESPRYKDYYDQVLAFFTVSHCLFTLAFGFLGAMLGSFLRRGANAASNSPTSGP